MLAVSGFLKAVKDWGPATHPPSHPLVSAQPPSLKEVVPRKIGAIGAIFLILIPKLTRESAARVAFSTTEMTGVPLSILRDPEKRERGSNEEV